MYWVICGPSSIPTHVRQVLWPTLHYAVPDAPKTKTFYESTSFEQYKAVNQKFADAIAKEYKPGDVGTLGVRICLGSGVDIWASLGK